MLIGGRKTPNGRRRLPEKESQEMVRDQDVYQVSAREDTPEDLSSQVFTAAGGSFCGFSHRRSSQVSTERD